MKITWLCQGGFLLEQDTLTLMLDPYLSDTCGKKNPRSRRRIPVEERFLSLRPHGILLTHDHLDHTDPETLAFFLKEDSAVTVLASPNAWEHARSFGGADNHYVRMTPRTRWSFGSLTVTAVPAAHSDPEAVGFLVEAEGRSYYFTGDTLYREDLFDFLPRDLFAVFLPVNGKGNNMNFADASAFARRTGAKYSVPMHFSLFDDLDPAAFHGQNPIVPKPFEPVVFP